MVQTASAPTTKHGISVVIMETKNKAKVDALFKQIEAGVQGGGFTVGHGYSIKLGHDKNDPTYVYVIEGDVESKDYQEAVQIASAWAAGWMAAMAAIKKHCV